MTGATCRLLNQPALSLEQGGMPLAEVRQAGDILEFDTSPGMRVLIHPKSSQD
jgi:hypothetical protein